MDILTELKTRRLYFDGGYGTMFHSCGLSPGELPEVWNITNSDVVCDIHKKYLEAGSDIISTNTFGANSLKFDGKTLPPLEDIIDAAVGNAKKAAKAFEPQKKYIALDVGPLGRLLKPIGDLNFEDAVKYFAEIMVCGAQKGVDLILIETMNDMYETKAAVLAAKENTDLPVFVSNVYDENKKMLTGASPMAMVAMLEGLGADAFGINCSLGPDKMGEAVDELLKYASVPVLINPNAGLPVIKDGKTTYEFDSVTFAELMTDFALKGACLLGGCCGTTPEHIKELVKRTKDIPYSFPKKKEYTLVSSYTHAVQFADKPMLIGERINPTGKPRFKEALREKNYDYILQEGIKQQDLGSDILDVNVGLPEIDEKTMLKNAVEKLQAVTDLPLQIDTADPVAMEAALRIYNGKPLINSVNGKEESMKSIFPLAKKYGGVVIALTLDETGIPKTADGRIKIAKKIIERAAEYGIEKKDIIADPLCMTVSAEPSSALVTLECIEKLNSMGIKTSLGISNVSFGLPERIIINSVFFTMAMQQGLSAAIMNPYSKEMMDAYFGFCAVSEMDENFEKYIEYASKSVQTGKEIKLEEIKQDEALKNAVFKGLKDAAPIHAKELLKTLPALEIINNCIIPALNEIGVAFEEKKAFLPQLLMSAEAAKAAFEEIKSYLAVKGEKRDKKCKIVLATVKGDIHDIGKNIVKILLENYDFDVIDLGKDVPAELIAQTAIDEKAPIVGLSALMTTTVPAMQETIELLHEKNVPCRVMVGGAVLTEEYADMIGADKYGKDAMESVRYAEEIYAGLK